MEHGSTERSEQQVPTKSFMTVRVQETLSWLALCNSETRQVQAGFPSRWRGLARGLLHVLETCVDTWSLAPADPFTLETMSIC